MSYSEDSVRFIVGLELGAESHERGDFEALDAVFQRLEGSLPPEASTAYQPLHIALHFLDGWIDARNHDWEYYPGILRPDWPRLARTIAADLKAGREITDDRVLAHFDVRPGRGPESFWKRWANKVWKRRAVEQ